MSSDYYVYAYERKIASKHGPAGSFYYIGKGMGNRARDNHRHIPVPKDPKRIVKIAENLTEEDAFSLEKSQIKEYGRIDNGTGCLRNLTDGGEGPSGYKFTEEQCAKNSAARKKYWENTESRAKQSAAQKKYYEDHPESRVKHSDIMKKVRGTTEARAKNSAALKKYYKNPEARAKNSAAQKIAQGTTEARAKRSVISKAVWTARRANQSKNHATLDQFIT